MYMDLVERIANIFPCRDGFCSPEMLIQPDDPDVRAVASSLSPSPTFDFVERVLDWIRSHITYTSDHDQFGMREYFALPSETLASRKGDCEDFANLSVSLLLSAFPPDSVRVCYGVSGQYNHAWCEVLVDGVWLFIDGTIPYVLTPQTTRPPTLFVEFYVYYDSEGGG